MGNLKIAYHLMMVMKQIAKIFAFGVFYEMLASADLYSCLVLTLCTVIVPLVEVTHKS